MQYLYYWEVECQNRNGRGLRARYFRIWLTHAIWDTFAHHRDVKVYMNYNTLSIQTTYAYFSVCSQVVDLALSPMRSEWYLDGHARSPNTALIIGDRSYLPHWLRWSSAANIAAAAICKNRHPWHTIYDVCTYSTSCRVPYMKKSTPHQDIVFEHPIHAILWTTNSTG